jgi:DNA-binding SARP family transcriptional activator
MPDIGRGSGGQRLTTCRGGVSGGHPGVVEATGGLRPTADRTSGPWGDGPGVGRIWGNNAMTGTPPTLSGLSVHLFGRLEIVACGQPVRLAGRHAQALAALLALRPRPRLRDAIAADLWPDFDGPSASSLRQALWLVRTGLANSGVEPDSVLDVGQDTLGLRSDLELETDVGSFEQMVAGGARTAARALDLYRGDLAEGLGHECFAADRERLSDLYEDALVAVAQDRLEAGDMAGARSAATQVLARDPLREEAHTVLIAAYGQAGSRSQVVRQYRRLCEVLQAELAVAPLPETDAMYRAALDDTVRRSRARASTMEPPKARGGRRVFDRSTLARVLSPSA